MRIRFTRTFGAVALLCALGVGAVGTAAVASAANAETTNTVDGDTLAPVVVTSAMLDGGALDVVAGQSIIVTEPDGSEWIGTGGSGDEAVAHFDAATSSDDVDFNGGFTSGEPGSTSVWMADCAGHRITFTIRVSS